MKTPEYYIERCLWLVKQNFYLFVSAESEYFHVIAAEPNLPWTTMTCSINHTRSSISDLRSHENDLDTSNHRKRLRKYLQSHVIKNTKKTQLFFYKRIFSTKDFLFQIKILGLFLIFHVFVTHLVYSLNTEVLEIFNRVSTDLREYHNCFYLTLVLLTNLILKIYVLKSFILHSPLLIKLRNYLNLSTLAGD